MKKTILLLSCLLITNFIYGKRFIAKLEFDGNANGQKRNISYTAHGASLTTDRHGRKNESYMFDGIDDFIEIPKELLNVNENTSFSIETYSYIQKTSGFYGENLEHPTVEVLYSVCTVPINTVKINSSSFTIMKIA